MTATLNEVESTSVESLKAKLDDPDVAASLSAILEHADLLAILLTGLNGLVGRAEIMSGALAEGVDDIRSLTGGMPADLDVKTVAADLSDLSRVLPKLTPGLAALADAGVIDKLQQPEVASALTTFLDNAELLAVLVQGLNGLIGRAEIMSGALAEGFGDMKSLVDVKSMVANVDVKAIAADLMPTDLLPPGLDVQALLADLTDLAGMLPKLTPSLNEIVSTGLIDEVMRSGLTETRSVDQVGVLAKGFAKGLNGPTPQVTGVLSLARHLKDPDISRGLGFALGLLKAVGAELTQPKHR